MLDEQNRHWHTAAIGRTVSITHFIMLTALFHVFSVSILLIAFHVFSVSTLLIALSGLSRASRDITPLYGGATIRTRVLSLSSADMLRILDGGMMTGVGRVGSLFT